MILITDSLEILDTRTYGSETWNDDDIRVKIIQIGDCWYRSTCIVHYKKNSEKVVDEKLNVVKEFTIVSEAKEFLTQMINKLETMKDDFDVEEDEEN